MQHLGSPSHLAEVPNEPKAGHISAPRRACLSQQGGCLCAALLHVLQGTCTSTLTCSSEDEISNSRRGALHPPY